jgi:alpha-mannosidase
VILPSRGFEHLPTQAVGAEAAGIMAAATALWHPSLIAATGVLPGWHSADELPDPAESEGELVVVPAVSRERMASDWCDRMRATAPRNPSPVEATVSRRETISALLRAASIEPDKVAAESVGDFLALGYAHLQVELLTQALRYTSVLDTEEFASAVVASARAAVAGNENERKEEIGRAFDLLADARNHVYSVDYYVIDVTLVADSTMGETLRAKLATNSATSVLITGEQIDRLAREHPETLEELKRAISTGTSCIVGGLKHGSAAASSSPESLLENFKIGQQTAQQHLGRDYEIFGQFETALSPLLPGMLKNLGFKGALHVAFDGGPLPRADQRKTNWGAEGATIEALSATPLDASRPETWLKLAERIGDTIAHDHVATIVLAGFPGTECEYFEDLRRAARFGSVLGKLLTLGEYFRDTREADEWTHFFPREYPDPAGTEYGANPISSRVESYRDDVRNVQQKVGRGLAAIAGLVESDASEPIAANMSVINPWNVAQNYVVGPKSLELSNQTVQADSGPRFFPEVPPYGYASLASTENVKPISLVKDLTLRNDWLELTVSKKTGGIQSIRPHNERHTRVSQRLVFHHQTGAEAAETRMVADKIDVTRNEPLLGEIRSRGRVLGAGGEVLTRFIQHVRAVRGQPAIIVDVELEPQQIPAGDLWKSYLASRLAWSEEAISFRCGRQWSGRETTRECIVSPEWIEIDDGIGRVTLMGMGLAFHRVAGPQWLDSLLVAAGEEARRFQFAIAIDQPYPTHAALAVSSSGPIVCASPKPMSTARGWFLHFGAKNIMCTNMETIEPPTSVLRLRLLETEGRETRTVVQAFRPFRSAWACDFRGNRLDILSVSEGRAEVDVGAYGWVQIEAEW